MALGKGLSSLLPQQKTRKIIRKETGISENGMQIWQLPIAEIVPNSEQPRRDFLRKEMEDLVASVKKHGILQPLIVTEKEDSGYELVVGERRLRAAQIAGLADVPAIIRTATQQQKLELALIENIQRQDLNPIEEAFAYKRLIDEFNLTQQEVAEQVGKGRPTIANLIRLLELPDEIQKALAAGKLSVGKARALLSLKKEKEMLDMFYNMMGEKVTVREVEKSVAAKGQKSRKGSVRRDPNLLAQEQLLEDRLGTKVHITQKGEKGTIVIEYYSREELERLMGELS